MVVNEQATKIQDAMIICAPVISQMMAEGALRDDWSYARGFHDEFVRRRRLVADRIGAMPKLAWSPTGGGCEGGGSRTESYPRSSRSKRLI